MQIDRKRLENFIRGKRVLVTGGGGSIGSEICTRVVAFGASDLLILESSEPSLHHISKTRRLSSDTNVDGVIADVRDRERVREVMNAFRRKWSSTPRPSSTCPISRRTGPRASRPTSSAR